MDYLKYYVAVLIQLAGYGGFLLGGNYIWLGVATLPIMAVLDSILPIDLAKRRMSSRAIANIPVWLCTLLGPGLYLMMAWYVGSHHLSAIQIAGAVLSCAWLSVLPLVPASHELYHQRSALARLVGHYAQVCYLDCTRDIGHVVRHHLDVGTVEDSDTAARGQTLYSFAPKAVLLTTIDCQKIESDALEKRGYGRWSIRHRLWKAIFAQTVFQALVYEIGGWSAVGIALGAMIVARFWIETFNYFQHYGQIRVKGTPIDRRHVWNHLRPLSRLSAFEITNHADHHLNSYTPYYTLTPHREAIPMPSVFVCFFAALIPQLWFKAIIQPALKRWDLQFASAAEKELAKAQNRRAGWPDWFESERRLAA
ncbi:MAG TPA: alkane 1-monooxygenase [Steroidobacteraceae bacterium]|jgi:alkane 1-monooxygenase/p-cymene monooxygenase|nr:MAG: alkane 1-monooxygenase [Betaproteobacteria bacterium]HWS67869.1 alkane 1-monooxygenase [Steroidobacteraceae bacterium]